MKFSYRGLTHSEAPWRIGENHSGRAGGGYFGEASP
jgi:hypothetical protein